jgi:hypothetical protein
MKITRLGAFTLGVVVTAVSVGAVSLTSAAGDATIKACANKKTGAMRYITKGACKKTETALSWNQMGSQGLQGSSGAAGAKGETGAVGPKGDAGSVGLKGDTGTAGSSSPTGFTARNVCGADGTTLCAVGVQGPGGGTIIYVDTTNEMQLYDYLEVAPTDVATDAPWASAYASCGPRTETDCQSSYLFDAVTSILYFGLGTGRAATAAIVAIHDAFGVERTEYVAGFADDYTTATASDWFVPSNDELNEMCKYARNTGQAPGARTVCLGGTLRSDFSAGIYWSSTEQDAMNARNQIFSNGNYSAALKTARHLLRPVRAF